MPLAFALLLPLSVDTLVVAAGLGARLGAANRLRWSLLFVGFEGGMPVVGALLGAAMARALSSLADYLAVAVLVIVGLLMVAERERDEDELGSLVGARGLAVVSLGIAISLDELAVGLSLGLLRLSLAPVVVLLGLQAAIASQAGLRLGARLRESWRAGAERGAGLLLIAFAAVLLVEHLRA